MINYQNGKKNSNEKTINYANRGMSLEDDLNDTNKYYLQNDIAAVYKKPTPITIVNVEYKSRSTAKITEAYFQVPSTTDYNGVEVLEQPKTKYQNFVHMCDYLASRKCILLPFDENNNIAV